MPRGLKQSSLLIKGMIEPRRPNLRVFAGFLAVLFCTASIVEAHIQQQSPAPATPADETSRAISLYQQGQNEEAIASLRAIVKRNKNDLRAWHYLGLAQEKKGDAKEARKAHEKAARLGEMLLDSRTDQVRGMEDYARLLKPISIELAEAGQSAQKYIELNPNLSRYKREEWSLRVDTLLGFDDIASGGPDIQTIFKPSQVDIKARILSKPEAAYTDEARSRMVKGTVILRAILAANGKVLGVYPIRVLPGGLTGQSIRAARQIKFVPAMKDGKPVSTYVQVEYMFDIY